MVNTQLLEEYISASGKTKSYLAMKLGMTIQTFRKKCTNQSDFTMVEADILCAEIGIKTFKDRQRVFLSKM